MPPNAISSFVTAPSDAGYQKEGRAPLSGISSLPFFPFFFFSDFNVEDKEGYDWVIIRGDLIGDGVGLYGSVDMVGLGYVDTSKGYRGDEYKGCLDVAREGVKELDTNGSLVFKVDLYEGAPLDIIGEVVDLYEGAPLDITGTPDEDNAFSYDGSVLISRAFDELTGLFDKLVTPMSAFSVIMGR